MSKTIIELIVGDLEEKREYRKFMKRVNALPKDYRFAYKKMQHYLYNFMACCKTSIFKDLLDLFEESAAEGRTVREVVGDDAAGFCDELVSVCSADAVTTGEKLNKEIMEHFHREEK